MERQLVLRTKDPDVRLQVFNANKDFFFFGKPSLETCTAGGVSGKSSSGTAAGGDKAEENERFFASGCGLGGSVRGRDATA